MNSNNLQVIHLYVGNEIGSKNIIYYFLFLPKKYYFLTVISTIIIQIVTHKGKCPLLCWIDKKSQYINLQFTTQLQNLHIVYIQIKIVYNVNDMFTKLVFKMADCRTLV